MAFNLFLVDHEVAPFAGAWIEIEYVGRRVKEGEMSLPSRERGLKYGYKCRSDKINVVAPFAGAWIEMKNVG